MGESAVGRSYCRQKKYGKALKKFTQTFNHFNDIAEDQFDFHNYCLRKTTLKTYVAMLRMQDRLFSHKFYRRAAKDAIGIYVVLHDQKALGLAAGNADDEGEKEEELSAAEKKKLKHKKKRAEAKVVDEQKKVEGSTSGGPGGKPRKVDDDPNGDKLLEKDPMEEAVKLLKTFVLFCGQDCATHTLTYEVFSRTGRWLHCVQALLRLWTLCGRDKLHYKLIAPLAHLCFVAKLDDEAVPAPVRQVVLSEIGLILGVNGDGMATTDDLRRAANPILDSVEQRMKSTPDLPVAEVLASLKCLKHGGRDSKAFLESWWREGAFSLKECRKMLTYLSDEYGPESVAHERFKSRCTEVFPRLRLA